MKKFAVLPIFTAFLLVIAKFCIETASPGVLFGARSVFDQSFSCKTVWTLSLNIKYLVRQSSVVTPRSISYCIPSYSYRGLQAVQDI